MEKIYIDLENIDSNNINTIQNHIDFFNKQKADILLRERKIKNINLKLDKLKSIIDNSDTKTFNYNDFLKNNDFKDIQNYENNMEILDTEINNMNEKYKK